MSTLRRLLGRHAGGAPTAFAVRVGGRAVAFAAAIVLARALGVEGYGVFTYAIAWSAVLIVPSLLGVNTLLMRNVAVYRARNDPGLTRGLLRHAHEQVVPLSLALSGLAAVAALVFVEPPYREAVLIALLIVPLRALIAVRTGALQGLRRAELSFLPVFVVYPTALAALVLAADALGADVTAELAVALAVAATVAGLVVAAASVRRLLGGFIAGAEPRLLRREWRREMRPLTVVSIATAVAPQVPLILTGALGDAQDVGVLGVAQRLAEPVSFVFMAVTVTSSPLFARYHDSGDRAALAEAAQRASRASLYWSLPIAAALIAAQGWLFGLFGAGFDGGGTALAILVGAALYNALAGSVGNVLLMTGHARPVAVAKSISLAVSVVLCVALIPHLGVTGAAIARAADLILWNSALAFVVWRRLGINATAIGARSSG